MMAAGHNLVEFILSNRLASNGHQIPTHYIRHKSFHIDRRSSNGGDIVVREDIVDDFVATYVNHVKNENNISLYEQPGDNFKYFVNICTNSIRMEVLSQFVRSVNSVIREFYPFVDTQTLESFLAVSRGTSVHKLTLVYPKLIVNSQRALMMRAMIVYKMQEIEGKMQEEVLGKQIIEFNNITNPHWEAAISTECYLSGSSQGRGNLLVGGSYKIRCRGNSMFACTKQSMNQCVECIGDGFITHGTPLTFLDQFLSDGTPVNVNKELSVDIVNQMSIRSRQNLTDGWNEVKGCVQIPLSIDNQGPSINTRFPSEKSIGKKRIESKLLIGLALKSIQRCHDNYKRIKIREMTDATKLNKPKYFVAVSGPGSSFCCNINDDHKDSRVYFEINSTGIQQRCWVCDNYKKKPEEMPDSSKRAFKFPIERHGGSTFLDRLEHEYMPIIDALRCGTSVPNKKKQRK